MELVTRNDRFMALFKWTGLTSNGLSVKLGMNSRTIYNYTNKGMDPTDTRCRQFCKVFPQVNEDWLFDGVGEMFVDGTNFECKDIPAPVADTSASRVPKTTELYERLVSALELRCKSLEDQLALAKQMIEVLRDK